MVFIHICVFVFVFAANPWAWGRQHRLAWEADGGQAAAGWDGQQATGKKKSCKETGGDAGDEDDGDYDDDDDGDNDVGNYGGCVASDDGGAQQQNVAEVLLRDKCLVFLYITNVIKCGLNIVVDRQGHAENNVEQILFQMPPRTPSAQGHHAPSPSPLPVQRWKSSSKSFFFLELFRENHTFPQNHICFSSISGPSPLLNQQAQRLLEEARQENRWFFFTSIGNIGYNRRNTNSPFSQNVGRSSEHFEGASEHLRAGGGSGKLDIF